MHDIAVIGAGPAGLTAAIYARRAGKTVLIIEKNSPGGQMSHSPKIENYPGMTSVSGVALADMMFDQALSLGAEIELEQATDIECGDTLTVVTDRGRHPAKAVIIASGATHRMLGVPNEERFIGDGISFCAVCDGAFYADKDVVVIGGGNSALQEAVLLSEICSSVTIIQDLDHLTGEQMLADKLAKTPNVKTVLGALVTGFAGGAELEGVEVRHKADGSSETVPCDGAFVAIGLIPETAVAANVAELTPRGYVDSDESCTTKTRGVFVAGDCRSKILRQISTAASDGAHAAIAACSFIDSL